MRSPAPVFTGCCHRKAGRSSTQHPAGKHATKFLAQLDSLGIKAITLPFEATPNGAVQSMADAKLYAEHFKANSDKIDGLVICLPNFGDEIAVAELVKQGQASTFPILLQASNDETRQGRMSHSRRDALLRQSSRSPTISGNTACRSPKTSHHTVDIASDEFKTDLDRFARVCRDGPWPDQCPYRLDRRAHRTGSRPCAIPKSCCRLPGSQLSPPISAR